MQEAELKLRPDIVVSTPGRLIDHVRNTPCFNMDGVEVLVLDEADRMLEEVCPSLLAGIIQELFIDIFFLVFLRSGFPSRTRRNYSSCSSIASNASLLCYRYRISVQSFEAIDEQTC